MRNAFQLFASFFFFPTHWKNPKISFSSFRSLAQPKTSVLYSRKHLSLSSPHPDFFFCFAFFQTNRGVFEAFERRRKVKSRDTLSRTFPKSSFTHTNIHLHFNINNNVCCYSTNRVRRRPQGHQGSSTCLILLFSFRDPIRSDRARARETSTSRNYLFAYLTPYTIRENKMRNDTLSLSEQSKPSSILRSR
jgi:hypothetical protein